MRYREIILEDLSPTAITKTIAIYGDKLNAALNAARRIPQNKMRFDTIDFMYSKEAGSQAGAFLLFLDGISPETGYVAWILKCFLAGNFRYIEDIYKVKEPLQKFTKAKPRLPVERRDINRFKSFQEFYDYMTSVEQDAMVSNREAERLEEKRLIDNGEAVIYHDDADVKIVIPKTIAASRWFGKNTQWCTAMKDNARFFKEYSQQGPLYIILFKKENKRWQFHFETASFMDERDRELDEQQVISVSNLFEDDTWANAISQDIMMLRFVRNPSKRLIALLRMAADTGGGVVQIEDDGRLTIDRYNVDEFTEGFFKVICALAADKLSRGNFHSALGGDKEFRITQIDLKVFLQLVKDCLVFQHENQKELETYYATHFVDAAGRAFAKVRTGYESAFSDDSSLYNNNEIGDPQATNGIALAGEVVQRYSDIDITTWDGEIEIRT